MTIMLDKVAATAPYLQPTTKVGFITGKRHNWTGRGTHMKPFIMTDTSAKVFSASVGFSVNSPSIMLYKLAR